MFGETIRSRKDRFPAVRSPGGRPRGHRASGWGGVPQPQQWGVTHAGSRSPLAFLSPSTAEVAALTGFQRPVRANPVSVKVKGLKVAAEILLNENCDRHAAGKAPCGGRCTVWRETHRVAGDGGSLPRFLDKDSWVRAGAIMEACLKVHTPPPASHYPPAHLGVPPTASPPEDPSLELRGGPCRHGRKALEIATLVVLV